MESADASCFTEMEGGHCFIKNLKITFSPFETRQMSKNQAKKLTYTNQNQTHFSKTLNSTFAKTEEEKKQTCPHEI